MADVSSAFIFKGEPTTGGKAGAPVPSPPQMRIRKPLAFSMSGMNMLRPTAGPPVGTSTSRVMRGHVVWCAAQERNTTQRNNHTLPNIDDLVGVEQRGETLDDAGTLLAAGHAIDEHQERLAIRPAQIRRLQL